jgi:hypothetical protein
VGVGGGEGGLCALHVLCWDVVDQRLTDVAGTRCHNKSGHKSGGKDSVHTSRPHSITQVALGNRHTHSMGFQPTPNASAVAAGVSYWAAAPGYLHTQRLATYLE